MRIVLYKVSAARHGLEIVRDDGTRERVECETRSYLLHDLLHYAVESEAHLANGFWGLLAQGKTLAELNDRTAALMTAQTSEIGVIEQVVGALHNAAKGIAAAVVWEGLCRYAEALERPLPPWLTEA